MKPRFVPIPPEAIGRTISNPSALACVVRLYHLAHSVSWAPLRLSVREFGSWGGLGHQTSSDLLDDLEGAGLLVRTAAPGRNQPTLIEVFDPTTEKPGHQEDQKPGHGSGQRPGHGSGHKNPPPPPTPPTPPDTDRDTTRDTIRDACETRNRDARVPVEDSRAAEPDQTKPHQSDVEIMASVHARGDSLDVALAIADCQAAQMKAHDGREPFTDRDRTAIRRAVSQGYTRADLALLWDYFCRSYDDEPQLARGKNGNAWLRWASLCNGSHPRRIEAAREWKARGYRDPAPPPRQKPRPAHLDTGRNVAETTAPTEYMDGEIFDFILRRSTDRAWPTVPNGAELEAAYTRRLQSSTFASMGQDDRWAVRCKATAEGWALDTDEGWDAAEGWARALLDDRARQLPLPTDEDDDT